MDGGHILFFVFEMLQCMLLEKLDALLTQPLIVFLLFPESEKLINTPEKLLMILINRIHPDIILFLPLKILPHIKPPLTAALI